jgi:hypothetical protein
MCDKCAGGNDIVLFIVIALVIVAFIVSYNGSDTTIVALIAVAVVIIGYTQLNKEHLETTRPLDNNVVGTDDVLNYNYDNNRYSEHGNISMARDIDSMEQRVIDVVIDNAGPIDNADSVESALEKHSSNFQPDRAHGFSSTSSAYLSNYTLGEPNPNTAKLSYSVPLNDAAYDLDESLSRGQQYRASINKRAIDGAVRHTRNSFARVFSNELNENEKRVWYSAEAEDLETDFRPYY